MKKKLLLFLFMLGSFIFCFNSIKAINITCGSSECSNATFSITQLTSTNTASGQSYSGYASHFQSYYQSTAACIKTDDGCTSLSGAYTFTMNYSNGSYSAQSNKKFVNLENAIKTSASYTKAGTYVFLVKQTSVSTGATKDSTEYIVYVNVKSDLSIGSAVAKRIKNSSGTTISAVKVTSLAFSLIGAYPSKPEAIYNVECDFYVSHAFGTGYADTSVQTGYYIKIPTSTSITAKIYNKNGFVKDVTLNSNSSYTYVSISHGEVLIIPKGSLTLGSKVGVHFYGMYGDGLDGNTLNVYKPSIKKSQNGSISTITSVQSAWANNAYDSSKANEVTIGGTGENYLEYTWTYDESLVPSTGVIIKVLPYVVMVGAIIAVGVLLVLTKKRKITDITE